MRKIIIIFTLSLITLSFFNTDIARAVDENYTQLTYENVYRMCIYYGLEHPEIVVAQSILETGHYKSSQCINNNNLFGLYDSNANKYFEFSHWTKSIMAYKDMVQYRYEGGDYYKFLNNIGYATDVKYTKKVKDIVKNIE